MDSEFDGYEIPHSPVEVNTRFDQTEGRLTWSPGHILPFESAWMICAKVMAINLLQWRELKKLIKIPAEQLDSRTNPFIYGRWLSISKFASLLGEPYNRIEKGFLDSLGFPESLAYRAGIRHCPKCMDLGYHCSLFNIQALTHCPWHEVPLTSPCDQCTRTVQTSLLHSTSDWLACPACGVRIIDLARPLARDRMSSQQLDDAFARCNQLVEWWRDVRKREPRANDLFGPVLCVADEFDELPEKLHLREGCLQSVVSPPEFWPFEPSCDAGQGHYLDSRWRVRD